MRVQASEIFERNRQAYLQGVHIIANKGGTRSGKTWSILLLLWVIANNATHRTLISVVSDTLPHLKRGAIRDFDNLLSNMGLVEGVDYEKNMTDCVYSFGYGQMEFFGCENAAKVHGPQRDILFVNEANSIPYEVYRQLAIRTDGTIFLDWNPTTRFWFDDRVSMQDGVTIIHSTYLDNPFLSAQQIREIESNKGDKNWWRVYGLGETGLIGGLVYTNWEVIADTAMPPIEDCKMHAIGIDFGFTHDPTPILDVRLAHGELWVDEIAYDRGLTNPDIASILIKNGYSRWDIIADSAEPKSIQEIKTFRLRVEASIKGNDSIRAGIGLLSRYKINVTARSIGLRNELQNYKYKQDADGNPRNEPIDYFNHALDALRYVVLNRLNKRRNGIQAFDL